MSTRELRAWVQRARYQAAKRRPYQPRQPRQQQPRQQQPPQQQPHPVDRPQAAQTRCRWTRHSRQTRRTRCSRQTRRVSKASCRLHKQGAGHYRAYNEISSCGRTAGDWSWYFGISCQSSQGLHGPHSRSSVSRRSHSRRRPRSKWVMHWKSNPPLNITLDFNKPYKREHIITSCSEELKKSASPSSFFCNGPMIVVLAPSSTENEINFILQHFHIFNFFYIIIFIGWLKILDYILPGCNMTKIIIVTSIPYTTCLLTVDAFLSVISFQRSQHQISQICSSYGDSP